MSSNVQVMQMHSAPLLKFFVIEFEKEVGRAFVLFVRADSSQGPVGVIWDGIFVAEQFLETKVGDSILRRIVQEAERRGCHKLVTFTVNGQTNPHTEGWYKSFGFERKGSEFQREFDVYQSIKN